jgi:hypothetical protein
MSRANNSFGASEKQLHEGKSTFLHEGNTMVNVAGMKIVMDDENQL